MEKESNGILTIEYSNILKIECKFVSINNSETIFK
jgi:hypothetical protein